MKIVRLASSDLEATLLPACGGKIASLRSVASGREWLWRNPAIPHAAPRRGASFVETMDSGGWDEIFPSVSPVTVEGLDIPDHGDLVALPWTVTAADSRSVTMEVTTRFAPCRFERRVTLDGPRLRLDYRLENLSSLTLPYLRCAHPLFRLEPGMTIGLPPGTPLHTGFTAGVSPVKNPVWPWPPGLGPDGRIPDSNTPGFHPFAAKIFTEAGTADSVSLEAPGGGERLRLRQKLAETPYLGLWINVRAWNGAGDTPYLNLGLEPATAPCDDLAEAVRKGTALRLPPGAVRTWSLSLELESPLSPKPRI